MEDFDLIKQMRDALDALLQPWPDRASATNAALALAAAGCRLGWPVEQQTERSERNRHMSDAQQTLRAILDTLIKANERDLLADTIWHTEHETLFDFIENSIEAISAPQPATPQSGWVRSIVDGLMNTNTDGVSAMSAELGAVLTYTTSGLRQDCKGACRCAAAGGAQRWSVVRSWVVGGCIQGRRQGAAVEVFQ